MPVSILLSTPSPKQQLFTTNIRRFYADEKADFLAGISYCYHRIIIDNHRIGKFGDRTEIRIYDKVSSFKICLGTLALNAEGVTLYYQEACRYWAKAADRRPYFRKNGKESVPSHWRSVPMMSREAAAFAACVLNSSLFYWYYSAFSDCEHINDKLVRRFPIPLIWNKSKHNWITLCEDLMDSLDTNSKKKQVSTKQGHIIEYNEISGSSSKEKIDIIEKELAKIYGLSATELDFIVNYDIKYRMGSTGTEP